ncbi:MAG TPA: oxidoreductase [Acidimicrobiaceae bacterium]|nr:oxidoreductase [Acidimicrobiaceae bacterium]HCB37104.1 oxidoreductase [Acidimicrobiaceae bacterium]
MTSNSEPAPPDSRRAVAFIGLGVMGLPMAGHLADAGHDTVVHNRTPARAQQWLDSRASGSTVAVAATPGAAAAGRDAVFVCVGADDDVRAVVCGDDGALAALAPGSVLVDHTTASAELARELHAACAAVGVGFVDAPVSGGEAGAVAGVLTVMCGGDRPHFDLVAPVISAYAQAVTLIGPAGSGQLTKMVNQICIAGLLQALSEGLEFGARAGLDLDLVLETISKGAAGSWQMSNRGATMAADEFDFGFAVDWMLKDLGIVLAEAKHNHAHLPATALVEQFYARLAERGGGRWDTSSLIRLLRPPRP